MDASSPAPGLSELRRELEEILALVSRDVKIEADSAYISARPVEPADSRPSTENDELLDDAVVVITEFGRATPAILQMWLSIDYACAAHLISRLEARGLVSAKGRVRHKAYDLRRTTSMGLRP